MADGGLFIRRAGRQHPRRTPGRRLRRPRYTPDEVLSLNTEHIHRHLAGNQFYIRLDTDGAQFRERRNVLVFERLLHQARGQRANPAQKARSTNSSQGPDTIEIFGWFRDQGR